MKKKKPVPVLARESVRPERYLVLDPVVERLHLLQVAALVIAEEKQVRLVLHLPLLVLPLAPGEGAIVLSHEASHGSVLLTAHLE